MRKLWIIFAGAYLLDQVTKFIIVSSMELGQSINVLPFFSLTYLTNTGIAFSMFTSGEASNIFFAVFTAVAIAVMVYLLYKDRNNMSSLQSIVLMLIIAGAFGNLTDRVLRGNVIDFLDCYVGAYHWPVFNVADSCLSVGAVILGLSYLRPVERKV